MSKNTNTEREAFEAWMAQQDQADPEPERTYEFDEAGMNQLTEDCMWVAWQARASLSLPAAGQEPYCWTVSGGHSMFRGQYAKQDALNEAKQCGGTAIALPLYAAPQPAVAAGWVSVKDRLPEWAARDDTPCFINNKEVPPTLTSETVLVALKGGGVRTDKLTTIEGKSDGWWHTYGERVVAWQKTPLPPAPSTEGESK